MSNYGIGYTGSKNKIADEITALFPRTTNFYDLFCGGCAITHAVLTKKKYKNVVFNDINEGITRLFIDAIRGKYNTEKKLDWVSKDDFFNKKDNDPYIKYIWSFGNMGRTYMYSEDIEPYKKALHYAICYKDYSLINSVFPGVDFTFLDGIDKVNARRLALQRYFKKSKIADNTPLESSVKTECLLQSFTRLQSLERLESLERLQSLERLESLTMLNKSYDEIEIKPDSVIYCDIPYIDTYDYNGVNFDYEKFYNWAAKQKELLFISSYELPADQFICVKEIAHRCTLNGDVKSDVIEKVFIPKHQEKQYKNAMPQPLLFDDLFY